MIPSNYLLRGVLLACMVAMGYAASAKGDDTLQVYFPFNKYNIDKHAEARIDSLIFGDVLIHGQKLIILGYADVVGGKPHNDSLSLQRARSVADYLAGAGFDRKDITLCAGRGQIQRANIKKDGYAEDRKVQIVIAASHRAAEIVKKETKEEPQNIVHKLQALKVNEAVPLDNILFVNSMDILLPSSMPELEGLLKFLQEHEKVKIRIEGHICCHPKDNPEETFSEGCTLSEMRAEKIYDYLVAKHINAWRLSCAGLGSQYPKVWPEVTMQDMAANRRVEVRILSK